MTYNPEKAPPAEEWLAIDESERTAMVESWHRRAGIHIPGAKVHAIVHTVVENQIALGESVVTQSLARLRSEGLSRHDAIHAIGTVLSKHIYHILQGTAAPDSEKVYYDRVRRLTAAEWLRSGEQS